MRQAADIIVAAPLAGPAARRAAPLLAALAAQARCRFLLPGPSARELAPGPAIAFAAWREDAALQALPHLFLLADAAEGAFALRAALLRPGLVVLEDGGLPRAHAALTRDRGLAAAWLRAVAAEHGPPGRRLAAAWLRHPPAEPAWRWLPMCEEVARRAALLVIRHPLVPLPPGCRAEVVPPGFPPLPLAAPDAPRRLRLLPGARPWLSLLQRAAAAAGCELTTSPDVPAALALALSAPPSDHDAHATAQALAEGLPLLAWADGPLAALPAGVVEPVPFGIDAEGLAERLQRALAELPARQAMVRAYIAGWGPEQEAARLLSLLQTACRGAAAAT
ncbi:MAG: hypothetical protein N2588_06335 [Rhodovarius sp.]|nr:hypothetical protein [Rhodovarius sp.]